MAKIEVSVQIATAYARLLSARRLREVVKKALRSEGSSGQVALVITDDEGIQALNRQYLGRDAPTDVLAFGAQETAASFVAAPEMAGYLGDVIVSYPRAVAQAEDEGQTVEAELNLLIVHGVLHLLGYDHADEQQRAAMWARQEAILADL